MQQSEGTVLEIIRRSRDVLGRYMDRDIHEYVYLEDGRAFVFESIAVESHRHSGIYLTDFPGESYILVNGNLLYREVTS